MEKVVKNTRAIVQVCVIIHKAVVQLVLLYGSKSLVVTVVVLKLIEVFHHQVAIRITGMMIEFPLVAEALETAGIWTIEEYIQWSQATVAAQVACRPIYATV